MSDSDQFPQKRRLPRSLQWIVFIASILGVAFLGVFLFREPALNRPIRRELRAAAAREFGDGGRYEFGAIRGSYVTGISVRDVLLVPEQGASPLRRLRARRVQVRYDVLALLRGRVVESLRFVDVEGFSVLLGPAAQAAGSAEGTADVGASLYAAAEALHQLPRLRLSGTVLLERDGTPVSVGITAAGEPREGLLLDVIPDPALWPEELPGTLSFVAGASPGFIRLSSVDHDGGRDLRVDVRTWASDPPEPTLRRVHVRIAYGGASLRLEAENRSIAFSVESEGHDPLTMYAARALPIRVRAGAWSAGVTAVSRSTRPANPLGRVVLSPARFADLYHATGSFRMQGWQVEGNELRTAHGSAALEPDQLHIGVVEAAFAELGTFAARDIVLDPSEPMGTAQLRLVRADLRDPAALAKASPEPYRPLLRGLEGAGVRIRGAGPNRYVVEEIAVRGADYTASLRGTVSLPPDRRSWGETVAELTYSVGIPRSSNLLTVLGLPDGTRFDGRILGSWDGTLRSGVGSARSEDAGLLVGGDVAFDLGFSASGTIEQVRLEELSLSNEGTSVRASGVIRPLQSRQLEKLALRAESGDLGPLAAVLGAGELAGGGSLEAELSGRIPRRGETFADALAGTYRVALQDARVAGQGISAASARGTVGDGQIVVGELRARAPGVAVEAAGEVTVSNEGATARFPRFQATLGTRDQTAVLTARDAVVLHGQPGRFVLEPVVLSGAGASVRIAASGPDPTEVQLSARSLPAEAFFRYVGAPWEAAGRFRVNVTVRRLVPQPHVSFGLAAEGLRVDGERGSVTVSGVHDGGGITLSAMDIDFGEALDLRGSGTLPVVLRPTGGLAVGGTVPEEFVLTGTSSAPYRFLRPFLAAEPQAPYRVKDVAFQARVRGLGDGRAEAAAVMTMDGEQVFVADGTLRRGEVAGETTLLLEAAGEVNVPLAAGVPFLPGVLHMAGSAGGSFSISGPLARPDPQATLRVRQGAVRLAGDVPTFSLVDAAATVDATGIRVSDLYAELGHAPVQARGSLSWGEGAPQLSVDLTGTDALLVRNPDLRARSDVDVSLRGTLPNLTLTGDLRLTDVLYTRPVQLVSFGSPRSVTQGVQLFSLRGSLAQGTTLDVAVQGADAVRIENNLLQASLSADVQVGGTAAVPEPEGRLFTDTGTVRLPLSTLQIEQAELRFPRGRAFQPVLRARLQTRLDERRISAVVSGPLSDLAVDVSSSPPLPNDEVLLLLTTGSTAAELTESATYRETAAALGTYLSRQVLQEIAGSGREGAVVDRLSVQVDPGIVAEGRGEFRIQYRVADEEPWYVILERREDDRYSLEFAYRLWF